MNNRPVINLYFNRNNAYAKFDFFTAIVANFFNKPFSYDFEFCEVDPTDDNDAYSYFLSEHNLTTADLPILCINNNIYTNYADAVRADVLY